MNTPSDAQANALRTLRGVVRRLNREADAARSELAALCPHDRLDPACPVCGLYRRLSVAGDELGPAADDLDAALLAGPHPSRKELR